MYSATGLSADGCLRPVASWPLLRRTLRRLAARCCWYLGVAEAGVVLLLLPRGGGRLLAPRRERRLEHRGQVGVRSGGRVKVLEEQLGPLEHEGAALLQPLVQLGRCPRLPPRGGRDQVRRACMAPQRR